MGTEKKDLYTQAVAAQMRAEIAAAGMSVVAAAKKAGIPRGTLVRYLDGSREIPVSVMYKIALALGVAVPVIADRADERFDSMSQADVSLAARDGDDEDENFAQQGEP